MADPIQFTIEPSLSINPSLNFPLWRTKLIREVAAMMPDVYGLVGIISMMSPAVFSSISFDCLCVNAFHFSYPRFYWSTFFRMTHSFPRRNIFPWLWNYFRNFREEEALQPNHRHTPCIYAFYPSVSRVAGRHWDRLPGSHHDCVVAC